MANEPIAVAFVEIRPDTRQFRDETDAQVKNQLGQDPLAIPGELKVTGVEQAQRDIERVTRDVSTVSVPVQPDLATFQSEIDDALKVADRPVIIPGQLQLEGLDEAAADVRNLTVDLQRVGQTAVSPVTETLGKDLRAASTSASQLALAVSSVQPLPEIGADTLGDQLDTTADSASQFGSTLNDAATAASGVVDVVNLATRATHTAAITQDQLVEATARDAQALSDLEDTTSNLSGATEGLVKVSENMFTILNLEKSSAERLTLAYKELGAIQDKMLARKAFVTRDLFEPGTHKARGLDIGGGERVPLKGTAGDPELIRLTEDAARAEEHLAEVRKTLKFDTTGLTAATEQGISVDNARVGTNQRVAASELRVAEATVAEGEAARQAAADEGGLLRIRQRRAAPIGPFRLAGAGLAIGAGVFAAAQALGALSDKLKVTGEEATTFEGRMRNVGSALLSFDIVGAFGALTDSTKVYSVEQLKLINQTPAAVSALKDFGEAANLANSAQAALAGLAQPPQFLQTALAREEGQGDTEGQIKVLEKIRDFYIRAKSTARQIGGDQREVNALLEAADKGIKGTNDEINQLTQSASGAGPGGARLSAQISSAEASGDLPRLGELLSKRAAAIEGEIKKVEGSRGQQDAAIAKLATLTAQIKATRAELDRRIAEVVGAAQEHAQPGREAEAFHRAGIGASALASTSEGLQAELTQLIEERDDLAARIAKLKLTGDSLKGLKALLQEANRAIEENTQALIDEEARHQAEMVAKAAAPLETEVLLAQIADDQSAEINALTTLRDFYQRKADQKGISVEVRNQYLAQVESFNNQIESIEASIAAEEDRHAQEAKTSRDKAHDNLLEGIGAKEQRILNLQARAETTAALGDDIKFQQQLVRFYLAQSNNQKLTVAERRAFRNQFVEAQAELKQLRADERQAEKDALRDDIASREDALQDKLTLAKLTEKTTKDDEAALRKLIAFYRKQAHNNKLSRAERRDFLIKERQAEAELRDLAKKTSDDGADFRKQQFEFMQTLTGFASSLVTNLIPGGATGGLVGGTALPPQASPRPTTRPAAGLAGGRPATAGQSNTQIALLRDLRSELRKINRGNAHPEAIGQRKRGSAAGDFSYQGTHGM